MCLSGGAYGPLEPVAGMVQAQRAQAPLQSPWGAQYRLGETPSLQSPIPTRPTSLSAAAGDCVILPVEQAVVASCFTIHGTDFRGTCLLKGIGFRETRGVWVAGPTALPSSAQGPWHSRTWCWVPEGAESWRASCPHGWGPCGWGSARPEVSWATG